MSRAPLRQSPVRPEIRLRFVDRSESAAVDELRMQEYANASGFSVQLDTLRWKRSDDESFVLVAERDGKLLATMRGEFIDSRELLEAKLECPWSFPPELRLPVLLLSRAATLSAERASGWNLALRHCFLRFAIARGAAMVIGTFVSGSPRESSLREMGYEFFQNPLGWQRSTYRSLRPVQVVALDLRQHGARALQYCETRGGSLAQSSTYRGEFPPLRFVRCL